MVKLNKIYTRTGDAGTTGLVDGSRCAKTHPRIAAIGAVEEVNAALGLVRVQALDEATDRALARIQNELFDLGADLATPFVVEEAAGAALRLIPAQVDRLEAEIDAHTAVLTPLTSFILPGGCVAAAHVHVARTVARRAELTALTAHALTPLNPVALRYLNRLSDYLFVLGRALNDQGAGDILWQPGATR